MCGIVDKLFSGGNFLSTIASIASVIPGPWQIPAMMSSGILALGEGNPLGAAMGFAGGMGGFSNLTSSLSGLGEGSNMLGGLDDLYKGIGEGLGGAATSGAAGSAFGGLGDIFGGMSLPNFGGLGSGTGAADIFGNASDFAGMGLDGVGSSLGGAAGSIGGMDLGGSSGGGGMTMGGSSGIDLGGGSFGLNPQGGGTNLSGSIEGLNPGGGGGMGSLMDILKQGSDLANGPYGKVASGLLQGLGAYQDYRGARKAQGALQDQLSELNQLYSPGSPYAKQMRNNIERRDAARGRRSQYGVREGQLAAALTNARSQQLSSPAYSNLNAAANNSAIPYGSLFGAGKSLISGLGGLFK